MSKWNVYTVENLFIATSYEHAVQLATEAKAKGEMKGAIDPESVEWIEAYDKNSQSVPWTRENQAILDRLERILAAVGTDFNDY